MSRPKVGAIGLFLTISLALSATALFTKYWIQWTVLSGFGGGGNYGIVPYDATKPTWFIACSLMMYVAMALFIPLILGYLHVSYKVHHHGCCHGIRHNFHSISVLCTLIAILEVTTFVLMAINASHYVSLWDNSNKMISSKMGYSSYLGLAAGIFAFLTGFISAHVSHHDCHY